MLVIGSAPVEHPTRNRNLFLTKGKITELKTIINASLVQISSFSYAPRFVFCGTCLYLFFRKINWQKLKES